MAGLFSTLTKIFGNKYDKDIAKINPIITEINKQYESLKSITNNDLRNKTIEFKQKINDFVAEERKKIEELKEKSKLKETSTQKKEELYKEIDNLEKIVLEKIENILNKHLKKT